MPHRECKQQALIDAPVEVVWGLLGDPNRHSEWWPTTVDAECEDLHEGCRYRAVVKSPTGRTEEHEFSVERLEDRKDILIRCHGVGTYTRFQLTEAQGGTFVDAEFGIDPLNLQTHVTSAVLGRRILRRWLEETMTALERGAVEQGRSATGT